MAKTGVVRNDQLFLGLTRQPMIFGVTYNYVFLNVFGSMIYFIATSDFKVVVLAAVLHGISYLICLREPLLIDLFLLKVRKCSRCRNRMYHNYRNSYDPF